MGADSGEAGGGRQDFRDGHTRNRDSAVAEGVRDKVRHGNLVLRVRPGADAEVREEIVSGWYRDLLRAEIPGLIKTWEPRFGVRVRGVFIQRMKTKRGSCNPETRTLRFNTELAKKPKECLEYIVLHEMVHLPERKHGPRFVALIEHFMTRWRDTRALLNRLPVRHEDWDY